MGKYFPYSPKLQDLTNQTGLIDRYRLKFTNQAFGLSAICLVSDSIDELMHLLLLLELAQFPEQYSLHSDLG